MKEWLSAREIADLALPEMPSTESAVVRLAKREAWAENPAYARKREGKGGGFEYHFKLLPTLAQVAYMERHIAVTADSTELVAADANDAAVLTGRAREERDARLAIIAAFERFSSGLPRLRQASHLQLFTDKYEMGTLAIDGWVKDLVPTIGKRSLQRWLSEKRSGRIDALAVDRSQARKGTGIFDRANDGKVRTVILTLLAQNPHYSAAQIRDQVESICGSTLWVPYKGAAEGMTKGVPVPPVRTFQAFIKTLRSDNRVVLTKLTDPDRYRSTMRPAGVGALRHVSEPNQLWQIDASPVDALCTDGRHSIYACIDVFSRRAILLVSKTPRASAVALLMRKAIIAWGVPDTVKTDNGSDFVARDTKRLLLALDIEPDVSDAYSPEQKGHIERFIRTFQHDCATLLPGFVGHSVADRKAIEGRKSFAARLGQSDAETFDVRLSGMDVQRVADRWAETIYEQRGHRGLQGLTPVQKWNTANYRPRRVDIRALDLLLMPVAGKDGIRTTTKFGIRINNYHYATPHILPDKLVLVRQDPEDIGHVLAFTPDGGTYLGEGTCPELSGIHPATFMKAVRQIHTEAIAEVANPVRKMLRDLAKGPAPIERALQLAAERDQEKVISLPEIIEAQATRQVTAALAAMDTISGRTPSEALDDQTAAEHRRLVALFHAEEADQDEAARDQVELLQEAHEADRRAAIAASLPENVTAVETPKTRYVRAVRIDRAMHAGEPVNAFDAMWLGQYQTTDEYRGHKAVHEEFGDSYLT